MFNPLASRGNYSWRARPAVCVLNQLTTCPNAGLISTAIFLASWIFFRVVYVKYSKQSTLSPTRPPKNTASVSRIGLQTRSPNG